MDDAPALPEATRDRTARRGWFGFSERPSDPTQPANDGDRDEREVVGAVLERVAGTPSVEREYT